MRLDIDKSKKVPAYKQIVEQFGEMIKAGELKPGDKLPTERALSLETGISRGTIKAAYALLLKMGKIETIQGSGSFIANTSGEDGVKKVTKEINDLLDKIEDVEMSLSEVERLFKQEIQRRMGQNIRLRVAWVDCCIESLTTASEQIAQMSKVESVGHLLAKVLTNPKQVTEDYDLIVTTAKHYEDLIQVIPEQIKKIQKITLSLKLLSVIEIAKIPKDKVTMSLCISEIFREIMKEQLLEFDNLNDIKMFTNQDALEVIKKALDESDYLLLPPEYIVCDNKEVIELLRLFESKGGKIISFEYQLDRGSMIHFEEEVDKRWQQKQREIEENRNGIYQ